MNFSSVLGRIELRHNSSSVYQKKTWSEDTFVVCVRERIKKVMIFLVS